MSMNTAEQLEENEQYDKAYEEYKKMYSSKPKNMEILERLGHLAMILDKKDDAQEYYHKILELDAMNAMAYEQLMDLYFHTDRYKYYISRGNLHIVQEELSHAINDFKKALDKTQKDEEISSTRFVLANLYEQTGKYNNAIDEYLRILDSAASNEIVYLKLANLYAIQDTMSGAIEILHRAIENGFDTLNIKENLAKLYLRAGQPDKAREFTQNDLVKVRSLLDAEENAAAFDILKGLNAEFKKMAQYHILFAQYYYNISEFEKSLESVSEYDKLEQNSPLTYQMKALIYEQKQDDYNAHLNWARLSVVKGEKDVALNEYLQAFQVKETDAELIRNIADLLEQTGDKMHAVEFWEKLIVVDATNKKALEKIAEFRHDIGDYRAEAETLEKLYILDNKNANVVKKLALAYEKVKNKEKALVYYNKFILKSRDSDEIEKIKNIIKKLENTQMEEDEGLIGKIIGLFAKK